MWRKRINVGVIVLTSLLSVSVLFPMIERSREAARKAQSTYNLKQLGQALRNYDDAFQCLPPGGVFNGEGVAFHDWSTFVDPFLWASPFRAKLDLDYPWDDPTNLDIFLEEHNPFFSNPCLPTTRSSDGLPLNHFAGNQQLLFRNSSVRLSNLTEISSTVLLGESNGSYPPRGYPYNWRDPTIGLKTSSDSFGCESRKTSLLVMVDGNVREFDSRSATNGVSGASASQTKNKQPVEEVAKPSEPYRIGERKRWKYLWIYGENALRHIRLSPDESLLEVNFNSIEYFTLGDWIGSFQAFATDKPIKRIVVKGGLTANELAPFLSLPQLVELDIANAKIDGNPEPVLSMAKPNVVIKR